MKRSSIPGPALLVFGLCIGCGALQHADDEADRGSTEPGYRRIHTRLVDPRARARVEPATLAEVPEASYAARPGTAASLPFATIRDDTRPVLAGHPRQLLALRQPVTWGADGVWSARLPLPAGYEEGDALLVEAIFGAGRGRWERPPVQPLRVEKEQDEPFVALHGVRRGTERPLLTAWATRPVPNVVWESRPIDLPPGASLEWSVGLQASAPDEPPVRFLLEACRDSTCERLDEVAVGPDSAWTPRSRSLAALAGQRRSFRFSSHSEGRGALPVVADPKILAPDADRAVNLVLLSIDTLRADHLGLYGHVRETAPFLSAWARSEATVLDRAVAEAATTDPSHMTMFTGHSAHVHGVRGSMTPLAAPLPTLAELLRAHGHETAAFTENGPLANDRGFRIGFDRYVENKSPALLTPTGQVDRTFAQARDWLEERKERPFFVFLHTFQVHAPYSPPAELLEAFTSDEHAAAIHPLATRYDAEIRVVDREIEALLNWFEQRGLMERTLWVILSDHGEEFYEHGSLGHATLPYQTVLHVPWILAGPRIPNGRRIDTPVHHLDLLPTLRDYFGLPVDGTLQGQSILPWLEEGASTPERPLLSSTWALPKGVGKPALALQLGPRKLVRLEQEGEVKRFLFDLASDPHERQGREASEAEAADLEQLMNLRLLDAALRRKALSTPTPRAAPPVLDPEREEKLRALGYIEDEEPPVPNELDPQTGGTAP